MNIPLPCPRCHGRVFTEGQYLVCISCGHEQEIKTEPKPLVEIDWTAIKNQASVRR